MINLKLELHGKVFRNPIFGASGTVGFGRELNQQFDLTKLGGLVSKAVTPRPRLGNFGPRIAETPQGMLNAVGLENPGLEQFVAQVLPEFEQLNCGRMINIAGNSVADYVSIAQALDDSAVDGCELNLSCPNVKAGLSFGASPELIEKVTAQVRQVTKKPIWVKLTPNVTSIADCAMAAEAGGADGVSLINTLLGMAIDIRSRRPIIRNNTGGLSGPAVKPVALRMVQAVYRAVNIPVIGLGGISCAEDVVEFLLAGATLVQVGTLVLTDPERFFSLAEDLEQLLAELGVNDVTELTGQLQLW